MNRTISIRLGLLALAAATLGACGDQGEPSAEALASAPPRPAKVMTVSDAGIARARRFTARVEAVQTVDLSFQVGGRLVDLPILEGRVVEAGGLIAGLDQADFRRAVREAEVTLSLRRKEYARKKELNARNVVSDQALDEAEAARDLAEVALDNARQRLDYTTIAAPFDALISQRLVDNYTNVQLGEPVARVQDVSELRLVFDVPEALVATVTKGRVAGVEAEFAFAPGQRFALVYRENATEPNDATQTYRVEFAMARPDNGLTILPGMTGTVIVHLLPADTEPGARVMVPVSALGSTAGGDFRVWLVDDENRVRPRAVSVGPVIGDHVAVTDGLIGGERIVTAGVQALRDGMEIRPRNGIGQ
ncbi:hypothetical protein CCR85_00980 [Rhodothalassium salexigens]|uniref:efflux RND transporter periplasmic adaptor subunit n=1 Tax=Rhodothalassium salexigens TaxID=1086 RepID=UPI0019114C50|nr:efflux RND transporter periplasmic adaptor subunit [Rhodothalassium salexigens]MBK5910067.1 hypothetical protein [Rhodothalassium salexigens]MBK5921766.1 hypothetical protein [Rhodothalassium salexigens]